MFYKHCNLGDSEKQVLLQFQVQGNESHIVSIAEMSNKILKNRQPGTKTRKHCTTSKGGPENL